MASSIEGRFPFLDKDVVELAASLPADYKLRVLDEKHVLKRAAVPLVPASIIGRSKQPYRAPDALAFIHTPEWLPPVIEPRAVEAAGVFDPRAVGALWEKCLRARDQVSNADNMALVGVLSTQLLHHQLVAQPIQIDAVRPATVIERT
jgi:asparagine synthase (glutamine-hydrolysing)